MVTPRPTVAYPAMVSGFTGEQQRAKLMGRSSTPPSTTGDLAAFFAVFRRRGAGTGVATTGICGAALAASSSNFRNQPRTFERLRGLTRNPAVSDSQSRLGAGNLWVRISTTSPL